MFEKNGENVAYITRLASVRKHANADRLQIATVMGDTVIVGLDAKEGDKVVYFDSNLCLNSDFCSFMNMYQESSLNNDATKKGYMNSKARVKVVNLRSEKSYGLVIGVSSIIEYLDSQGIKVNDSDMKEGESFNSICGVNICNRYIVPKPVNTPRINNSEKTAKVKVVNFPEHWDTKQFKRNIHNIPVGATIYIEEKIHGCLRNSTKILMADGSKKRIDSIVINDIVVGVDKNNNIIESKVTNVFNNGKSDGWNEVRFNRENSLGEKRGLVVCTKNHKFYTPSGKYVESSLLKSGDEIYNISDDYRICENSKQVIIGKILGDGSVNKSTLKSISISQGEKQYDYFIWARKMLDGIVADSIDKKISGYGTTMYRCVLKHAWSINRIILNCIINKRLQESIVNEISPLGLAVWYMDDGNRSHSNKQVDRVGFAICRYNSDDEKIIKKIFAKFDINIVTFIDNRGYLRGRINKDDAEKFFLLVRRYIPESMQYKLPECHRGHYDDTIENVNNIKWFEKHKCKVTSITPLKNKFGKYDIETETHNFIANGTIVHNSSGRTSVASITRNPSITEKIAKFFGAKITKYDEQAVNGTRRTVRYKVGENPDYRDEIFIRIKDHLKIGEQVYYEIYGYSSHNGMIQKGFPYGCEPGTYKAMLYRMTINMPDGKVYDMGREYVYKMAEKIGIERPHVFEKFIFDGDYDKLLEKVESYTDGKSAIDSNTIREGVVVWFEDNNGEWTCLKNKSFEFLNFESRDDFVDAEDES